MVSWLLLFFSSISKCQEHGGTEGPREGSGFLSALHPVLREKGENTGWKEQEKSEGVEKEFSCVYKGRKLFSLRVYGIR